MTNDSPTLIASLVPYVQTLAPILQLAIVVYGWKVLERNTRKSEIRKEARTLIDSIVQRVRGIEKDAYEYYRMSPEKSSDLATKIKLELQSLSAALQLLPRIDRSFSTSEQMVAFYTSVSGDDFESQIRVARGSSSPLFQEISLAAADLIEVMETSFADLFWPPIR